MRVRMYSDTVLPRADGVAVALEALGRALLELNAGIEVVAPREQYTGTLPIHQVPAFRPPMRDYHVGLILPWAHTNHLSPKDFDVVHIHTLGPVGLAGLTAAHNAGIPAVLTWHTDLVAYRPYYPELRLGTLMANLTLRRLRPRDHDGLRSRDVVQLLRRMWAAFDRVIAPTEKVRQMLEALRCPAPIATLPSPTLPLPSPEYGAEELRRRLGIDPGSPVVLSVGRLSGEKNLDLLVRSFALVKQDFPNAHLVLVGPLRGAHNIRGTAGKLKIDTCVHMPGAVGRDRLGAYYSAADIFVVPSLSETQCLVASEAEAFRLPVIVVDEGLVESPYERPRILAKPVPQDLSKVMADCLRATRSTIRKGYPGPTEFLPAPHIQAMKLLQIYSQIKARETSK